MLAKDEKHSIDTSVLSVIFQAVNVYGDSPNDPLSVAKVLGGPVMVIILPKNEDLGGIDHIHLSAKQYIMPASETKLPSQLPRLLKPRRLRQLFRGRTALWYFGNCMAGRANLEIYREDPCTAYDAWWDTPHPVVVYGLWDAVTLAILPDGLDSEEIVMAQLLCGLLSRFLTTDDCRVWVESAIIINYPWRLAEPA